MMKTVKQCLRAQKKFWRWGWRHQRTTILVIAFLVVLEFCWQFWLYDLCAYDLYLLLGKDSILKWFLEEMVLISTLPITLLIGIMHISFKRLDYYFALKDEHRARIRKIQEEKRARDRKEPIREEEQFEPEEPQSEEEQYEPEEPQSEEEQFEHKMKKKNTTRGNRQKAKVGRQQRLAEEREKRQQHYYEEREKGLKLFAEARKQAASHIDRLLKQADREALLGHAYMLTQDEAELSFEDFSFVYGNQVYAVRLAFEEIFRRGGLKLQRHVDNYDNVSDIGKSQQEYVDRCMDAGLIPCYYTVEPGTLLPADPDGWNLYMADTGEAVVPPAMVVPRLVEMSPWEIHTQMALFVMEYLRTERPQMKVWRASPAHQTDMLWCEEDGNKEWIILRQVSKIAPLTQFQLNRYNYRVPTLTYRTGYMAQFTYSRMGPSGRQIVVKKPYRCLTYDIGFEGLQTVKY